VPAPSPAGAQFWGKIKGIHGSWIVLALRTGKLLQVDITEARAEGTTIQPGIGEFVTLNGRLNQRGVLQAHLMMRAKGPMSWGPDKSMEDEDIWRP
jgi:hypothetical protein